MSLPASLSAKPQLSIGARVIISSAKLPSFVHGSGGHIINALGIILWIWSLGVLFAVPTGSREISIAYCFHWSAGRYGLYNRFRDDTLAANCR